MDDTQTINAVRRRASNPRRRTDQSDISETEVASVASSRQIREAEHSLGFPLPELFRKLLQEVGNGGYGPGYGLLGTPGGFTDDQGNSFVSLYESFASKDPDDPAWNWPRGLVPICHWGCAIYSCVDCLKNDEMYVWDPNVWEAGQSPKTAIRALNRDFRSWLTAWSSDTDLWTEMYSSEGLE